VVLLPMSSPLERIGLYLRMIKFSHSVFALPFAFTGALLGASGLPSAGKIFWIVLAMVGARSGAMGLNRIIDRKIDRENPRTRNREIPSEKIRVAEAAFFTAISLAVFVFAAYRLNLLCFKLSPLAVLVLVVYFDVLYALQDIEFDRSRGLFSIPQRFGVEKTLLFSRVFHGITVVLLLYTGFLFNVGEFYWTGMAIVATLFLYEHSLLKPHDLGKLDIAFFNMNGYISATVFLFTLLDYVV